MHDNQLDTLSRYPLLNQIRTPDDLRKLPPGVLDSLAAEIRSAIIDAVARHGGHLASNLGVVELTIALHYAFNSPYDKFVWDVGHQVYTHKLLTGRLAPFVDGLRKKGGTAGFPKKDESAHDHYDTGHSGTSISFALGMAEAMRAAGSSNRVVAIIGDGSMTSGVSFEALNQTGHLKNENLIVLLNDNEMSISPNVGGLAEYISRRMVSRRPAQLRKMVKNLLQSIPRAGTDLIRLVQKIERSIKDLIQPGLLFEELGFQYLGPFDGHRLQGLVELFENIRTIPGPLLVHVLTRKGFGYKPAESEPERFHGAPPFNVQTGAFEEKSGPPSYTSVFGKAVCDLAHADDRIVAITAAMTLGTGLAQFAREFPGRFYDVGIAEQHAVTFAGGLSSQGKLPVVAIYSTFLQRAYDQVFHDICLQNLPVIFAIDRGGVVGEDGPTHHGIFDPAYLRHLPRLAVIAPRDENELRRAMFSAVTYNMPVAIRYPRGSGVGVPVVMNPRTFALGEAEVLRAGSDLTIVAAGPLVYEALAAAEDLEAEGIHIEVIDARFIKPLDSARILESIRKTGRLLTIEESSLAGGMGSAVLELLEGHAVNLEQVDRMGIPDQFVGLGTPKELRKELGLCRDDIIRRIRLLVSRRPADLPFRDESAQQHHGLHPSRSSTHPPRRHRE